MSTRERAEGYRKQAQTCLDLARRMSFNSDWARLIEMSEHWMRLAELADAESGGDEDAG